jgi:hypothetical protein
MSEVAERTHGNSHPLLLTIVLARNLSVDVNIAVDDPNAVTW